MFCRLLSEPGKFLTDTLAAPCLMAAWLRWSTNEPPMKPEEKIAQLIYTLQDKSNRRPGYA